MQTSENTRMAMTLDIRRGGTAFYQYRQDAPARQPIPLSRRDEPLDFSHICIIRWQYRPTSDDVPAHIFMPVSIPCPLPGHNPHGQPRYSIIRIIDYTKNYISSKNFIKFVFLSANKKHRKIFFGLAQNRIMF